MTTWVQVKSGFGRAALACALLATAVTLVSCDGGGGSTNTNLTGAWNCSFHSKDNDISFRDTQMVITGAGGSFQVVWLGSTGSLTLDTNTLAVVINVGAAPGTLSLYGSVDGDSMSGGGTIAMGDALRQVEWSADRK